MADGCCQAARKRWETMSGMILNRLHPKFAAKSVANEMQYLKAMLWPALTGQTSIFDFQFFQQSDFVDNHLVCYWPTIHSLILKICPTFQVLSSHFFKFDKLLDEHWAKIVLSEHISTPIYVECYRSAVPSDLLRPPPPLLSGLTTCSVMRQTTCLKKAVRRRVGVTGGCERVGSWERGHEEGETLNMNIWLHCFGVLGVGPRARTLPHVRAWCMGVIMGIVEP